MRNTHIAPLSISLLLAHSFNSIAETPHWIWQENHGGAAQPNELCFLRKNFSLATKPNKALLSIAVGGEATVYVNGQEVAHAKDYDKPAFEDVSSAVVKGQNIIAIRASSTKADQAGVLAVLELKPNQNRKESEFIVTDSTWLNSEKNQAGWLETNFDDKSWAEEVSRGKLGEQPWRDVLKAPQATAAESLTVLPGFKVELLHSAQFGEGSWICMATDSKGRLIISPQADNQPLLRVTLDRSGQVKRDRK